METAKQIVKKISPEKGIISALAKNPVEPTQALQAIVLDTAIDIIIVLGARVYCPDRLRLFVASIKKTGAYLLPKNLTQALGYSAVEKHFSAWRATLGEAAKPFSMHGLRKLAIVQLAEAGCSDAEIQAVTNQSPAMVAFYRQKANRKKLSKSAQIRRDQNRNET